MPNSQNLNNDPLHIFVIDDERANLVLIEKTLSIHGFRVSCEGDSQKAIERVKNENFDVILLDIMMPNVDGYQVLNHLKSNDALAKIKVIILSAKNKTSDIELGLKLGVNKYIPKPFSTKKLVIEVNELLNKK